ncbi:hypothetical protein C0J52_05342 [Blattella germanica]|nr:hypothetical protein C0J52_05342 [Blattella germanica]
MPLVPEFSWIRTVSPEYLIQMEIAHLPLLTLLLGLGLGPTFKIVMTQENTPSSTPSTAIWKHLFFCIDKWYLVEVVLKLYFTYSTQSQLTLCRF